jgi:hypothetical protein
MLDRCRTGIGRGEVHATVEGQLERGQAPASVKRSPSGPAVR